MSNGRTWGEADVALLKRMDERRVGLDEMAERLARPRRSVEVKLHFVRMGPEKYAAYLRKHREQAMRRKSLPPTSIQPTARHALTKTETWFGRCPAFRPRTEADANQETRL